MEELVHQIVRQSYLGESGDSSFMILAFTIISACSLAAAIGILIAVRRFNQDTAILLLLCGAMGLSSFLLHQSNVRMLSNVRVFYDVQVAALMEALSHPNRVSVTSEKDTVYLKVRMPPSASGAKDTEAEVKLSAADVQRINKEAAKDGYSPIRTAPSPTSKK